MNVCRFSLPQMRQFLWTKKKKITIAINCKGLSLYIDPIMILNQNPQQTVTHIGCVGFSMNACGFSVPQMQQFCLFSYPPRSKWASSEKMNFRCLSVYTIIFVRRRDKTNYLLNQTWSKCYHLRNRHYLNKRTLDGGPYTINAITKSITITITKILNFYFIVYKIST